MRKIINTIFEVVMVIIFGVALAVFAMEWMAGCGEYYIDSKGAVHQNECLFINIDN